MGATAGSLAAVDPPTYGTGEVHAVVRDLMSYQEIQSLDQRDKLGPSYYRSREGGPLIPAAEVQQKRQEQGSAKGDPLREYTYTDILWIRLLAHIRDELRRSYGRPARAARTAEDVVGKLRAQEGKDNPPRGRVVFIAGLIYLVKESGEIEGVTEPGQGVLRQIVAGEICADVQGRLLVLKVATPRSTAAGA